jgi:hypothetical protein
MSRYSVFCRELLELSLELSVEFPGGLRCLLRCFCLLPGPFRLRSLLQLSGFLEALPLGSVRRLR